MIWNLRLAAAHRGIWKASELLVPEPDKVAALEQHAPVLTPAIMPIAMSSLVMSR